MRIHVRGHILVWILLLLVVGNLRAETEPKGMVDSLVVAHDSVADKTDKSDGLDKTEKSAAAMRADSVKQSVAAMRADSAMRAMQQRDSLWAQRDSMDRFSGVQERKEPKKSQLSGPVHYQSNDSMIMMGNGTAYLHGKGDLKYESMELQADFIRMNMDSSLIYAHGVWDDLEEEWVGKPVFNDGKES